MFNLLKVTSIRFSFSQHLFTFHFHAVNKRNCRISAAEILNLVYNVDYLIDVTTIVLSIGICSVHEYTTKEIKIL